MNKNILINGMKSLKIAFNDRQIDNFSKYSELLLEWNEKINLTAITDPDGIANKHFLDSILPLKHIEIPENASLIDVGTGAGFPGIPLKIMREDIELTLLDSLNKRINFLKETVSALNLKKCNCIHLRAEEGGRRPGMREHFDVAVSRAVSNLEVLSEYCLPYVKLGGIFIAFKSSELDEELKDSKAMIGNLGGTVKEVLKLDIPNTDLKRSFVIIEKTAHTPKSFPRTSARINKNKKSKKEDKTEK